MNAAGPIIASVVYLLLLFVLASWAEKRARSKRSLINNPVVYALSLAVYCTAWTFYGSVGRASVTGVEFFTIYMGPTLMAPLFLVVLRKMIRISRQYGLTSIADFIATRYGRNFSLGVLVTILCVLGIIPYIAIQLKAISSSLDVITGNQGGKAPMAASTTFYIALGIALFVILFGTRRVDATERHEGLVAAIAFESVIKLVAFLAAGIFITYGLYNGFGDLFAAAGRVPQLSRHFTLSGNVNTAHILLMLLLSMLAVLLLPRQFQVAVVENVSERHLRPSMWLFPLYLFLINLFVLPIAFAGYLLLDGSVNPDTYVLALPMNSGQNLLALLIYIGGFSAASSMIIVETIAISTMISNHIVLPLFLRAQRGQEGAFVRTILYSRRFSIVAVITAALFYERYVAERYSLVSIGLVSFVAVAQFAPAVIGGMFWRGATKVATISGMVAGFAIWFYTLVLPSIAGAGLLPTSLVTEGPWQIGWLRPGALLGLEGIDPIAHGFFWSLLLNAGCYYGLSLYTRQSPEERYQAELFVQVYRHNGVNGEPGLWQGKTTIAELRSLLGRFLGASRAQALLRHYEIRNKVDLKQQRDADPALVRYAERLLSGAIGASSAGIVVRSVLQEEQIRIDEVLRMLQESQAVKEANRELRKKSAELRRATEQLQEANRQLRAVDELKDEFLYTVTHELRTPLTSIRALSEILFDNPDLPGTQRQDYLEAVIRETERLSHLITQVLNLERYESGKKQLHTAPINLAELLQETVSATLPLAVRKKLQVRKAFPPQLPDLEGDRDLLAQVCYNLLSNAIRHAREQILVSVTSTGNRFLISVSDDGPGVPAGMHELIFDKFFQAKNQHLKKPEGSGLGLAICRKIVEMHDGKIWVESTEGTGATFRIELANRETNSPPSPDYEPQKSAL